jgi:hypothetical protein
MIRFGFVVDRRLKQRRWLDQVQRLRSNDWPMKMIVVEQLRNFFFLYCYCEMTFFKNRLFLLVHQMFPHDQVVVNIMNSFFNLFF